MKVSDSGMPEETYWNSLFDVPAIIDWLNIDAIRFPIVEIGCGYGTFTAPLARTTKNKIYAFDIEQEMIDTTRKIIETAGMANVELQRRDVIEQTTGLRSDSIGMVLLFNILHSEDRRIFLEEACRILKPDGIAAIIHWRKDIPTPRGPLVQLRPDENIILESIYEINLSHHGESRIIEPYHWGIKLVKGEKA